MRGNGDVLYGLTSFRMYRIPHQVLPLCPPMPSLWQHVRDPELLDHPVIREILGTPLHLLITDRRDRRTSKAIRTHLVESTLPPGAIAETVLDIQACSPLFTLLTLARHLSTIELAMAMYEFCGNFSVFRPSPAIEELLQTPESIALAKSPQGWRRVTSSARTSSGGQSSLWMRPPLISLDELNRFARQCAPIRGCRRFAQAARLVTGVASSPFEVQLSLLLSLPREMGGKHITGFCNNGRVPLSKPARSLYACNNVYADLLFEADESHCGLDVECQGAIIHNDSNQALSDADRAMALAAQGIETLWVTHRQILDIDSFQAVAEIIGDRLGIPLEKPDPHARGLEQELRRTLMIDWVDLGLPAANA